MAIAITRINASAVAIAIALNASAVFAQDAAPASTPDAGGETVGNAIIVTAARREQTLQEVPIAVSVLSGDTLDDAGVNAVQQISEVAPSVTFTAGSNENNSSLNIRGIGTTVFSAAAEPAVSIVVDDVVLARAGQGFQDFIDIERVEVLRGPQSTLFGKNASAGVVSVTTKSPGNYLTGKFDAMYAEGGEVQLRGAVSGPISDTLGAGISGFYKQYDGYTKNVFNGDEYNGYETWGVRGKLALEASPAARFTLIGDYRDSKSTPMYVITSAPGTDFRNALLPVVPSPTNRDVNIDTAPDSDSEQWGASLKGEFDIGDDFTLTSITAFRDWKFANNVDVDSTSLAAPQGGVSFLWNINQSDNALKQYSQEVRFASGNLGGFDFLVGGYAFKLDYDSSFERRLDFGAVQRSGRFDGNTKTTNLAAFASGNVYVGDATIFGGVRYLWEKLEWSVFRDPTNVLVAGDLPLGGRPGMPADFSGDTSDSAVVGNIGLRYDLSSYTNVYGSYSRGYKGKAYDVIFGTIETNEPADAEKSDAFELGMKTSTPDGVLSLNLAAFYTKYDNFQSQAQVPGEIAFVLANAGKISTRGVEAEASIAPNDLLTINLGAAYIDAKIDSFPGGPCYDDQTATLGCVNGTQDLSGATLPNAPKYRFTTFVKQIVPLGDGLPFDAFVQSNMAFQSDTQFQLNQDQRTILDGHFKVNAALGITSKDESWMLQAFVRNLFNEKSPASLTYFNLYGGRGLVQPSREQERYFGARASYKF